MRISDWSSDVCSSDLMPPMDYRIADSGMWAQHDGPSPAENMMDEAAFVLRKSQKDRERNYSEFLARLAGDRKSVVEGKSVSVRVDLGGRRIIKQKKR